MNEQRQLELRPELRDLLAAERTFLAWIRTGLALMGFGFVVARFGLFLQQVQVIQHPALPPAYGLSLWFGTALIAAGVVVFLQAARHHVRLIRGLNRREPVPSRPSAHAVVIALLGLCIPTAKVTPLLRGGKRKWEVRGRRQLSKSVIAC